MKEATAVAKARGLARVGISQEDFRTLYNRHYDAVLAYFVRRSGQATAQDLTAEVFLVAWRRIDEVPRGEETVLWLYGVAANVAAHQRRSVARRVRLETRLRSVWSSDQPDEPEPQTWEAPWEAIRSADVEPAGLYPELWRTGEFPEPAWLEAHAERMDTDDAKVP